METMYQVLKMILIAVFCIESLFAPKIAGGDYPPSEPVASGDETKYVQITAPDEGFDVFQPVGFEGYAGYRYGQTMILNTDGSLDVWSASNGPGDYIDVVNYKRYSADFKKSTKEVTAVTPTAETYDYDPVPCACDPGVIKFGGWYYIAYSTNMTCVARSKNPEGPFFEKWTGDGWGVNPAPIITYDGTPGYFGAAEPCFVVMGDTLYIFYTWWDEHGPATRVATADATDENWPATIVHHGECIPPKDGGDSADVKYVDEYGRFVAVFTERRFTDNSYVAVWESFDGLTFRRSGFIKDNTCKKLHNCGISGRADGHIGKGDPVYLSYAYAGADTTGSWANWGTRMHKVTLSLADAPMVDLSTLTHSDVVVTPRKVSVVPEVTAVKAEQLSYTINKSKVIMIMAFDTDGFCFPLLTDLRFDGYDKSVIRMVGTCIVPVAPGDTRVYVHWHGLSDSFVVHVTE